MPLHCPAAAASSHAGTRHRACTPGRSQSEVATTAVDVQVRVPSLAPQHAHAIVLTGSCSSVRQKPAGDRASCPARSVGRSLVHAFVCCLRGERPLTGIGECVMRWLWLVIALPALFSLSSLMCDLIACMCVALVVCATSVCCSVVSSRRGWQYRLWHAACVHRGRPATQHHCMVPVDVEYVSRVVACGRNFYIRTLIWM